MNIHAKSKVELLNDLNKLQQKYDALVALYEKKIEESIQSEQTLRQNEANFKAIIENSLESIWSIDLNYNIQYTNEIFKIAFRKSFGVTLDKGVNILEALPKNLRTIWKERYDRAFEGEHFVFTDRIELENSVIYVEVAMNPVIIEDKVVGASFFGKDITQRMLSAEVLKESETRFRALHNASFGGIVIHDKGKILLCNQGLASMTGYSVDELIGMDGTYLIAESSRELVKNKINHGDERPYEAVGLRKNGEEFPIRLEGKNVPYKGKMVRTTEFRDITEQKKAEKELWEREEIFRHFMENSPIYLFFKDENLKTIALSRNYEKLLGLPMSQLVGKSMYELFPSEFAKKIIDDDKKILNEGKLIEVEEELNGRHFSTIKFPIIIDNKSRFLAGYTIDITERKMAEDTLRSSEEKLKILFNNAPEAYYLCDLKGNFVDGNIAAEKLLGYDRNELIGKNFLKLNLLPKRYLAKASKLLAVSMLKKPTGPDEMVLIRKDGLKVNVEISTHPVTIEGKTLVLGITRDIGDRKRAEKAMRQASENWNRTFQSMHSGIALLDANQKIIQTNKAFRTFLNASEAQLLNKYCLPLLLEDKYQEENNLVDRMKRSKACETAEIQLNGRFTEVLVDPVLDSDGKISGAVLILNDITQRKRDEDIQQILHEITATPMVDKTLSELLFIVRKLLSKVIDTKNFFVALYKPETETLQKIIFEDEKDDFIEWDAHKSLSGQVLKLRKPLLLKSEEEARFAAENNIELLGSPAACWLGVPLISGDNAIGVMVVQSYSDVNAYDNSTVRLLILIAHELSIIIERKKMIQDLVAAKDRAEESDRLKSAFLANMSHEIRTPMNGILGFAELLKEPKLSGEEQQMFIDIIEKSGERMLNIINDLINISKIESGQMDVYFSETNINEQLEFLYNFFKLEAKQKNLKLIVNYPVGKEQANIETDREKVYAILTNLIKNSIKFTKNGTIEFGYQVAESKIIFYIKDTGIGIPQHKQQVIFERFVQASSGMSSVYEGAGLGLSIAKAYVEMLGGEIWIESEPGKGTCFYFTLPVKLKTEVEGQNNYEPIADFGANIQSDTILIAEDDESSLIYLTLLLKNSNLKILVAKTGGEAVEMCRNNENISLVLMDISMPVIDGYIAAQIIKQFNPGLPILAQTAFALDEDKEKYHDTFDDYITKPIKADELKHKIRKYLARTEVH